MNKKLRNKPIFQLIIALLLFGLSCIKITALTYLFGGLLLISLLMYLIVDDHLVLEIDDNKLTLYSANGTNSDSISLDKIQYWQIAEVSGNLTMVFTNEKAEDNICTIVTNNTLGLSFIFNHYLKDNNYKLKKLNSPYEAVGKALRKE